MAHLLTPPPTTAATPLSAARARKSLLYSWKNGHFPTSKVCCFHHQYQQSQPSSISDLNKVPPHRGHSLHRRTLVGLSGAAVVGLGLVDEQRASGAARRPPPPPTEKKDPSVSGVMAKILASKRRKEAMKEEVDKLRARGKSVNKEAPPPPPPPPPE
ncbi:hypothetical protein ACSQ67_005944 [Phaseolus vulgaris]